MIDFFLKDPRKIFLLDSFGALVTAICIGVIMVQFNSLFNIPVKILYTLASIAVFLCIYSFSVFKIFPKKWPMLLKFLSQMNLAYCIITVLMLLTFRQSITAWSMAYFTCEIVIILILVSFEQRLVSRFKQVKRQ